MINQYRHLKEIIIWSCMMKLIKHWSEHHMDQWEKVKFDSAYGEIYVTISMQDPHPDSFDKHNT